MSNTLPTLTTSVVNSQVVGNQKKKQHNYYNASSSELVKLRLIQKQLVPGRSRACSATDLWGRVILSCSDLELGPSSELSSGSATIGTISDHLQQIEMLYRAI